MVDGLTEMEMDMDVMTKPWKFLSVLFVLMIVLVGTSCGIKYNSYKNDVAFFQELTLTDAEEKIQNDESFFIYIGRESCPYCQEFVPKLAQAVKETGVIVYYLDSGKLEKTEWMNFKNSLEFRTIPNLTYFSNGIVMERFQNRNQVGVEDVIEFLVEMDNSR